MSTFKEFAKQINKKYKDGNVLLAGDVLPTVELLSMGTLGFDYASSGGLPEGTIVEFAGQFSSGKSLAAALAIAQYQRKHPDKVCLYVDVENAYRSQKDFFKRMTGLQTDENHLYVYNCVGKSANTILEDILDMQKGIDDIGMIVIDSTAALVTEDDMESDFSKDNGMRGTPAKVAGKFCRMMTGLVAQKNNILLTINQTRTVGKTFTGANIYDEPGGSAWRFYATVRFRFGTRTFIKDGKQDVSLSNAEGATGFRLKYALTKTRIGAANRGGGFLTFDLENGLDVINDNIEVAIASGFIHRPNNQTYVLLDPKTGEIRTDKDGNELKFVGKAKLTAFLKENEDFRTKYFAELTDYISGSQSKNKNFSLLDKEDFDKIMEEDASVEVTAKKKTKEVKEK